jgi:hypothetical protein
MANIQLEWCDHSDLGACGGRTPFYIYVYSYNCPENLQCKRKSSLQRSVDSSPLLALALPSAKVQAGGNRCKSRISVQPKQRATSSGIPELRTVDQLRPNEFPHEPWSRHSLARKTANLSAACRPPHQKSCCFGPCVADGHTLCGCNSRLFDNL